MRIRGELASGHIFVATDLYTVGSFDPDHDAVMRIGGEAPGGGPILSVGMPRAIVRKTASPSRSSVRGRRGRLVWGFPVSRGFFPRLAFDR